MRETDILPVESFEAENKYLESWEKQVLYTEPLWPLIVTISVNRGLLQSINPSSALT